MVKDMERENVNPNKEVSIPWQDVKEIISPAEKPLERWKND